MQVFPAVEERKSCVVIMPAYNEEEALPAVLEEWSAAAAQADGSLAVLNDGSKDGTLELLRESQQKYPNLIVIDKPNSGHAPTCVAGYNWAIEEGFEWIFQTDSDGQTLGSEFLTAWKHRDGENFIFGYRPSRGDGFARWIISRVLRMSILTIFRTRVLDANVPFRLMKADALAPLVAKVPPDLFLGNAYLSVVVARSATPMKWMNITFEPRQGGIPSVSMKRFTSVGMKVIKDFWGLRKK